MTADAPVLNDRDVKRCRQCGGWRYRPSYLACQQCGAPANRRVRIWRGGRHNKKAFR